MQSGMQQVVRSGMESGPAVFAGVTLVVFGAALVWWTSARLRSRQRVADGVPVLLGAVLAVVCGVISLAAGGWVLFSA